MKKRTFLLSIMLAAAQTVSAFAAGAGPGTLNLSASDTYSKYQWGFSNDGGLSLNISDLKRESFDELYQSYRDWFSSGQIGIPPRNLEPGDFENRKVQAVEGVDMNVAEAFSLYRTDGNSSQGTQTLPGAGTEGTGTGIAAQGAQARREVVVAIIDTGIDTEHPELRNAIWTNEDEIPGDGIDNDGNGYIDDVHGYNFYDHTARVRDNKISDMHGTHAAGTIAAAYGNGGITGICDSHVKIMVLKVLSRSGAGSEESITEAIRYAEQNGADICNLSLGGTKYLPALEQTIANSSMLFVAAAGNGDENGIGYNTDENPVYPADYACENMISVANLMFDGTLDISSNYGAESVDIAAPGSYVLSTIPGGGFDFLTGTSMAAPMVTGVCAMVYSWRTDLGLLAVKEAVLNTARQLDTLSGKVKSGGIPDLYAAMTYEAEQSK